MRGTYKLIIYITSDIEICKQNGGFSRILQFLRCVKASRSHRETCVGYFGTD